jgi:uncharacterized protein YraI
MKRAGEKRARASARSPVSAVFAVVGAGLVISAVFGIVLAVLGLSARPGSAQGPTPAPTADPFSLNVQPTIDFGGGPTATAPPSLTGVNGYASVNTAIRSGPGLEYRRIGFLPGGASIDIVGYNGYALDRPCSPDFTADLDMWVQVAYRDTTGWMARCTLRITGEFNLRVMLNNAPPAGSRPPRGYTPPAPTPGG